MAIVVLVVRVRWQRPATDGNFSAAVNRMQRQASLLPRPRLLLAVVVVLLAGEQPSPLR